MLNNFYSAIPENLTDEQFEDILKTENVRIERILSQGQTSPESGWYDQTENEWVILLQGAAEIAFDDGQRFRLGAGDHLNIIKHQKHRVSWTDPDQVCIWLAVFYL